MLISLIESLDIFSLPARKCRAYADYTQIYGQLPADRIAQLVLIIFPVLLQFYYNSLLQLLRLAILSVRVAYARRKPYTYISWSNNSGVMQFY